MTVDVQTRTDFRTRAGQLLSADTHFFKLNGIFTSRRYVLMQHSWTVVSSNFTRSKARCAALFVVNQVGIEVSTIFTDLYMYSVKTSHVAYSAKTCTSSAVGVHYNHALFILSLNINNYDKGD